MSLPIYAAASRHVLEADGKVHLPLLLVKPGPERRLSRWRYCTMKWILYIANLLFKLQNITITQESVLPHSKKLVRR